MTQSPSITQETKARFNELLNAALSKEAESPRGVGLFTKSSIDIGPNAERVSFFSVTTVSSLVNLQITIIIFSNFDHGCSPIYNLAVLRVYNHGKRAVG